MSGSVAGKWHLRVGKRTVQAQQKMCNSYPKWTESGVFTDLEIVPGSWNVQWEVKSVERSVGKQRQDHEVGGAIQFPCLLESKRPLIIRYTLYLFYKSFQGKNGNTTLNAPISFKTNNIIPLSMWTLFSIPKSEFASKTSWHYLPRKDLAILSHFLSFSCWLYFSFSSL